MEQLCLLQTHVSLALQGSCSCYWWYVLDLEGCNKSVDSRRQELSLIQRRCVARLGATWGSHVAVSISPCYLWAERTQFRSLSLPVLLLSWRAFCGCATSSSYGQEGRSHNFLFSGHGSGHSQTQRCLRDSQNSTALLRHCGSCSESSHKAAGTTPAGRSAREALS